MSEKLILQYLASPETKEAVVDGLSRNPHEAFQAILGFQGPYPANIHPIDVHEEYLTGLLAALLRRCPELLIGPKPAKIPETPYILIAAAIATNDPRFADTILLGLKGRSIYLKLASVHGIMRCAFLRTPEVRQRLVDLLKLKSVAKDEYSSERIQAALRLIDGGATPGSSTPPRR